MSKGQNTLFTTQRINFQEVGNHYRGFDIVIKKFPHLRKWSLRPSTSDQPSLAQPRCGLKFFTLTLVAQAKLLGELQYPTWLRLQHNFLLWIASLTQAKELTDELSSIQFGSDYYVILLINLPALPIPNEITLPDYMNSDRKSSPTLQAIPQTQGSIGRLELTNQPNYNSNNTTIFANQLSKQRP